MSSRTLSVAILSFSLLGMAACTSPLAEGNRVRKADTTRAPGIVYNGGDAQAPHAGAGDAAPAATGTDGSAGGSRSAGSVREYVESFPQSK